MSNSENDIKFNLKNEILEIADFEPFFMYLFGMKIPENLKPNLSISLLPEIQVPVLSAENIENIDKFLEILEMQERSNEIRSENIKRLSLRTIPKSMNPPENREVKELKVSADFSIFLKLKNSEFKSAKEEIGRFVKIKWLSNYLGEDFITPGLPNVETMPNDVFQIGIQPTSTKEYFKYISTSENRKVGIRFKVWSQYRNDKSHDVRIEKIAQFFKEFEQFEEQIKNHVQSISFYFDELGHKEMKLVLKNSIVVEKHENSQHPSLDFGFIQVYEEVKIKSGQNRIDGLGNP